MKHNPQDYQFQLWKDSDGYWLADVNSKFNGGVYHTFTSGKTKEEVLMMVADVIMCMEDIKIGWWNRIVSKLLIYKK